MTFNNLTFILFLFWVNEKSAFSPFRLPYIFKIYAKFSFLFLIEKNIKCGLIGFAKIAEATFASEIIQIIITSKEKLKYVRMKTFFPHHYKLPFFGKPNNYR